MNKIDRSATLVPAVGAQVERGVRRRLRRAILAEARRVASEHRFGCSCFTVDAASGGVVRMEPSREYAVLSDLLHLCAQLDGRLPVDA